MLPVLLLRHPRHSATWVLGVLPRPPQPTRPSFGSSMQIMTDHFAPYSVSSSQRLEPTMVCRHCNSSSAYLLSPRQSWEDTASTRFQSIMIEEGETIQQLNSSFNWLALLVFASRKKLSTPRKLHQYFCALCLHPSFHILLELQRWQSKYEEGKPVLLAYIQLVIQWHEEKLFPDKDGLAHKRAKPKSHQAPSNDSHCSGNHSCFRPRRGDGYQHAPKRSQTNRVRTDDEPKSAANAAQ